MNRSFLHMSQRTQRTQHLLAVHISTACFAPQYKSLSLHLWHRPLQKSRRTVR